MNFYEMILKKRRGGEHTEEELREIIRGYTDGSIPDYQMSAWAMAVCFQGMTERECAAMTLAMAQSGDTVDLSPLGEHTMDKHSTGGVGDKTTLLVAPIVAASGGVIAKMSGRGLGHTGGTVDKLESIPGYRTTLTRAEFLAQARKTGVAVIGQSGELTPADRKLYALRDVTGTVDSIPLIASSVMSKKLAAGAQTIVLDVTFGSGAFFRTREAAEEAAALMCAIGRANGRRVSALLSDMDVPLGYAIGNALEVREAADLLAGRKEIPDLREISLALASRLLAFGLGLSLPEAEARAADALASGSAYRQMLLWVRGQGGDASYLENPERLPEAPLTETVLAEQSGWISATDTAEVGMCALVLGAGREKKGDPIDPGAGIRLLRKTGDRVAKGEPIAVLYSSSPARLSAGAERFRRATVYADTPPVSRPLIAGILD